MSANPRPSTFYKVILSVNALLLATLVCLQIIELKRNSQRDASEKSARAAADKVSRALPSGRTATVQAARSYGIPRPRTVDPSNPPEEPTTVAVNEAANTVVVETLATSSRPGGIVAGGIIGGSYDTLITGRVSFSSVPPEEKLIQFEATCGRLLKEPVTTRHYVLGQSNGLANVFVYVKEGLANRNYAPPPEKPLLDQVNCEYQPYVMGVQSGQVFKIRNSDPLVHNVHATPRIEGNKEFNIAQPHEGQINERSFPSREMAVRFKCDVHPWMFAYVGVFDHPYWAVADADGHFTIRGMPPGNYTLAAYHVKTHGTQPGVLKDVVVRAGTASMVEFQLTRDGG